MPLDEEKVIAESARTAYPLVPDTEQFSNIKTLPLEKLVAAAPVIRNGKMLKEAGLLAAKDELAKIMEVLLERDTLTSITILGEDMLMGSRVGRFGAVVVDDVIFKPETRMEVLGGNDPRNTRHPSLPISDKITIEIVGPPPPPATVVYPLLSMATVAPAFTVMLEIVTVIFGAVGLAATIPPILMLSVMLPWTTTFHRTMLVHDKATLVSAVGSVVPTVEQFGRTPPATSHGHNTTVKISLHMKQ